jgi:hypothetical protein
MANRTLLAVWQEHCARATPMELSSASAMDKHLAFPAKLVQEGLAGSALDGKEDVQDLIAKWTSQSSATAFPNAGCCSCNCSCSSVHHCTTRTDSLSSQTLVAPWHVFCCG